jgi:hypothetical protein
MAILALFWSATGLRIGGAMSGGDIRLAARKIIGEVRELRGLAAATHQQHVLHWDLATNRYWGVEVPEEDEGEEAFSSLVKRQDSEDVPEYAETLPRGVSVTGISVTGRDDVRGGRAEIRFRENGCVEQAWIHLRNEEDRSITLEIHPVTGRVEVHEGDVEEQAG